MMAEAAGSIGSKTTIRGAIRGSGSVRVEGRLEGRVELDEALDVGPSAVTQAEIHARSVRVEGHCEGVVHAHRLSVAAGATLLADAVVEEFQVEEGAKLGGRLRMKLELPSGLETI